MTSKNDVLTQILMYFCQKSCSGTTLQTPLSLSFTTITDHLRAEEVLPGCGVQSGAATVRIPVSFRSQAVESAGGVGFSVGPILSLFLRGLLVPHRSGQVPKTGSLYSILTNHTHHTFHGLGSCNLDLVGLSLLVQK
jgi:hypothetical protein